MTQSENSLQRLRERVLQLRETKEKKFLEYQGAISSKAQEISDKIENLEKMIESAAEMLETKRENVRQITEQRDEARAAIERIDFNITQMSSCMIL